MFKYLLSVRKDLMSIFLCSVFVILLMDFWLINIPEIFSGAHKIGQLIYRICLSYVSAFIFYFFVVHIKQQKEKEILNIYISEKVSTIIHHAKGIVTSMSTSTNIILKEDYPTKAEMDKMCRIINPQAVVSNFHIAIKKQRNWFELFNYHVLSSKEVIKEIFIRIHYFDSELFLKLSNIEDTIFFYSMSPKVLQCTNTSLINFKPLIEEYLELIKDLEIYSKKYLSYNN